MAQVQGTPIWYELTTSQGNLAAAGDFYERVLGWQVSDAGMEGFTYHLASSGAGMVAGLMEAPDDVSDMPPMWLVYFGVDDCDAAAQAIMAAGGSIHRQPADIPGTGRFAIAGDPQGAGFGILSPLPMPGGQENNAFDQSKAGHGNWHDLMTSDPDAAFDFYSGLFGWQKSDAIDTGVMGIYQLFRHDGTDIGGMVGLGNAPHPNWLPYFGVNGVDDAITRIKDAGGTVHDGPMEVPGGAFIAIANDPQGAWFAIVGPKEHTA